MRWRQVGWADTCSQRSGVGWVGRVPVANEVGLAGSGGLASKACSLTVCGRDTDKSYSYNTCVLICCDAYICVTSGACGRHAGTHARSICAFQQAHA
eukprot:1193847-Prorocentrum_minimum.AAC.7